jgi:hypothetical protein
MPRGRTPDPLRIVAGLTGSTSAKQRLARMLQTLTGEVSIPAAAAALHVGRSRFCLQRRAMLQTALAELEPKTRGRPPDPVSRQEQRIAELEAAVQALKIDLRAAQIREELALVMPHVLHRRSARRKKNARGKPRRAAGVSGRGHTGVTPRRTARPNAAADRGSHAP